MGRPERIKDVGIIVVGRRRREDEEEGVDREEDLAERGHVDDGVVISWLYVCSTWFSNVSCSKDDEAISAT